MDQQNNTGAPSTDTTSALFVSARKKQLEQQEAERQAKEREAERLAAEAEVRRLEQEVAERKRRAQEEAQRVEQEAAQRREQAQQEAQRVEQEAARRRVQAQQGVQRAEQEAAMRARAAAQPGATPPQAKAATTKAGLPKNKLVLIGGAAAVLIVAVVLIVVLSSGGGASYNPQNFNNEISAADGLTLSYPEKWVGDTLLSNGNGLFLKADDDMTALAVMDVTSGLNQAVSSGTDAVTAAEGLLYDVAGVFAGGSPVSDMVPQLIKSGTMVQGSAGFRYQDEGGDMQGVAKIESIEGARTILMAYAVPEGKSADKQQKACEAILATLMIGDPGDSEEYGTEAETPYWETDARFMLYSDGQTGIRAYISTELEGQDEVMLISNDVPFSGVAFGEKLMMLDFTSLYRAMMEQRGSLTDVVNIYLQFMEEANGGPLDNVSIGEPMADASGTRIDFSFDMEGANVCALRLFEAEDVCMIAIGHDLGAAVQEYFDVMAASMSVAVG